MSDYEVERQRRIEENRHNDSLQRTARRFLEEGCRSKYSYNFSWLGRPIIQYPQDMVALQEIVWAVRPNLIIETGIAYGGSIVFSASLLALLTVCDESSLQDDFREQFKKRRVVGVDIDIRQHNRVAIEKHPLSEMITMIEGPSVDPETIEKVKTIATDYERVLVCLDSNHTHTHVLNELNAYASLTTVGSYCIVSDTVIEDLPANSFPDRPWSRGNNPKTAVWEFLKDHPEFEIDRDIEDRFQITACRDGYLRKTGT